MKGETKKGKQPKSGFMFEQLQVISMVNSYKSSNMVVYLPYFEKYIVYKIINSILMKSSLSNNLQLSKHKSTFGLLPFFGFPFHCNFANPFSIVKSQIYIQSQMNLILLFGVFSIALSLERQKFIVSNATCPKTMSCKTNTCYRIKIQSKGFDRHICSNPQTFKLENNQLLSKNYSYCTYNYNGTLCRSRICSFPNPTGCEDELPFNIKAYAKPLTFTFGSSKCKSASCNGNCYYQNSTTYKNYYEQKCLINASPDNFGIKSLYTVNYTICPNNTKNQKGQACFNCYNTQDIKKMELGFCMDDYFYYDKTLAEYMQMMTGNHQVLISKFVSLTLCLLVSVLLS